MIQVPARIERIISPSHVVLWVPSERLSDVRLERERIGASMGLLTLKKWLRRRSQGPRSQNNFIHGAAQAIANHTGHSLDEVKTVAKERAIARGYPVKHDEDGFVIISSLTGRAMPESSANVNVTEASFLIEELQAIAIELDILLPE